MTDGEDRIERCARLLEDHPDAAATQRCRIGADVLAGEPDMTGDLGARTEQSHHRQAGRTLAAAAFADQAVDLTGPHVQIDASDGVDDTLWRVEANRESAQFQQWYIAHALRGCGGALKAAARKSMCSTG